jgi:serine/threonine protein kinase
MNRELGILNETRAIDRLCKSSHPNIVQVLQHGYLGNAGSFYFVDMELCDLSLAEYTGGKTVAPLLDWNSLPQEKRPFHVLTILEQVVDGMIFIHGHREIHRDLHPANGALSSEFCCLTYICSVILLYGRVLENRRFWTDVRGRIRCIGHDPLRIREARVSTTGDDYRAAIPLQQ